MAKYLVTGGTPLRGEVKLAGAKNAGFKAMIAALLADSPSQICGLGLISEVEFAQEVISSLGGKVESLSDPHCLVIAPANINSFTIPKEVGSKSRSSTMYVGPLLARFGKAVLPAPGGDPISRRPIDRHIEGLKELGATVEFRDGTYIVTAPKGLKGTTYRFAKNTHTGTETLIMAAVAASGTTVLENSAADPEIDDLIKFLQAMGGDVRRVAPRTVKIVGGKKLRGAKHTIISDRHEVVTFGCMTLATRGEIEVGDIDPQILTAYLEAVKNIGGGIEVQGQKVKIFWKDKLLAANITTAPYPGFMTDWQPLWVTLLTQANGVSTVHETIYENRFGFIPALVKMGAKIELFNPKVQSPDLVYNFNLEDDKPTNFHAAKIFGPTKLHGGQITVNDVRGGATAIMAGLIARGQTTIIDPTNQIDRGYENLVSRLVALGAKIAKVES